MAARVDHQKCVGSGACAEACAVEAIKIEGNKAIIDKDECIDCGACVDACPSAAIELE
ncbi:MAG: ferredoxin [Armatimonadetes bacterium RBG_16_58_9]|nr:MAG: ferredoxin [Armatimonadetes bacterium RBG_16_58_9]